MGIYIWDVEQNSSPKIFEEHGCPIYSFALSADGKYILSGSADKTVNFWDFETGKLVKTLKEFSSPILSVVISSDGRLAAFGSSSGEIKIWDFTNEAIILTFKYPGCFYSFAFSQNGSHLIAAGLYSVMNWEIIRSPEIRMISFLSGKIPKPRLPSFLDSIKKNPPLLRDYLIQFAVDQTLETIRLSVETGRSERCFNCYIPFRVRQIKRMPRDISAAISQRFLQTLRTSNNLGEEASKKLIASLIHK